LNFLLLILVTPLLLAATHIKKLNNSQTVSLHEITGSQNLAIVFQQNCVACQKQVKDLKCLEGDYNIILLGAFSSEKALRTEYLKMKVSYPAYYASEDILKTLGVHQVITPQILGFSEELTTVFTGYRNCRDLHRMLQKSVPKNTNESQKAST